jgi:flagellar biogenesis protein FliO
LGGTTLEKQRTLILFFTLFFMACCLGPVITVQAASKRPSQPAQPITGKTGSNLAQSPAGAASVSSNDFSTNSYYYTPPSKGGGTGSVLLALLKTLIVLFVIGAGVYYILRYLAKKQNVGNINSDMVRLISQSPLSLGKHISIVKIINSYYILSVSEAGIHVIKELREGDELDQVRLLESKTPSVTIIPFQEQLRALAGKLGLKLPGSGNTGSGNTGSGSAGRGTSGGGSAGGRTGEEHDNPKTGNFSKIMTDKNIDFLRKQKERLQKMNGKDKHE